MKKKIYKYRKYIIGTFSILVVIPALIAAAASWNILPSMTSSNDWIGFWGTYFGAILGGAVTFLGIRYTIKEGRHDAIVPYLIFEKVKLSDIPDGFIMNAMVLNVMSENTKDTKEIYIRLKNVGKGVAKDIEIIDEDGGNNKVIPFLECGKEAHFAIIHYFFIPDYKSISGDREQIIVKYTSQSRCKKFKLIYKDLLGDKKYEYEFTVDYKCIIKNQKKCIVKGKLKDWHMV